MELSPSIELNNQFEERLTHLVTKGEIELGYRDLVQPEEIVIELKRLNDLREGTLSMVHAIIPIDEFGRHYNLVAVAPGNNTHPELAVELERLRLIRDGRIECGSIFLPSGETVRQSYSYGVACRTAEELIGSYVREKKTKEESLQREKERQQKKTSSHERRSTFYRHKYGL